MFGSISIKEERAMKKTIGGLQSIFANSVARSVQLSTLVAASMFLWTGTASALGNIPIPEFFSVGTVTSNPATVCSSTKTASTTYGTPGVTATKVTISGSIVTTGGTVCATLSFPASFTGSFGVGNVPSTGTFPVFIGNFSAVTGVINPKYRIVGLTYAPPGSKSTAGYTSGFQSGTNTSMTTTASNEVTVTAKLTTGGDFFGFVDGSVTSTASAGWTQEQDTSSSIAIAQQYSSGLTVPGPPLVSNQDQGVDHDYDTVYIWINPVDQLSFSNTTPIYTGSYYDQRDGDTPESCNGTTFAGITGMDVVPLTVGQLRGTQVITDSCLLERLSRPWDPVLGGLNGTDFLQIAAADPFYLNPSFNPNVDTSGRFQVPQGTVSFPFVPGSATHTFSAGVTTTNTAGQSVKNTYTVSFATSGQASASFLAAVADNFSASDKVTYTNQNSNTITSGTSQSMNYSVVPPAVGTYNGATQIQVWQDNIYGTFMFFPEN
jgi:hypothetical protein